MENTPVLETERLILRRFTMEDADAVFRLYSDPAVNRFLPWYPLKSGEEAETYLRDFYLDSYRRPSGYRYAVCRKVDNIPIGYVHVSGGEERDLGYALQKNYWGKGYTTEAARAVLERLRAAGYPFATATHDVNNPASGGVMRKIGMTYRYSYQEQWMPKNIPVTFRLYQIDFDGRGEETYMEYWDRYSIHFVESVV